MKSKMLTGVCAAVLMLATACTVAAGPIESACNRSDRKASNRQLCNCIQKVANSSLRKGDQRRAATFFNSPEKAHKAWMSKNGSDDAFWERYKSFGAQAKQYCSAY